MNPVAADVSRLLRRCRAAGINSIVVDGSGAHAADQLDNRFGDRILDLRFGISPADLLMVETLLAAASGQVLYLETDESPVGEEAAVLLLDYAAHRIKAMRPSTAPLIVLGGLVPGPALAALIQTTPSWSQCADRAVLRCLI